MIGKLAISDLEWRYNREEYAEQRPAILAELRRRATEGASVRARCSLERIEKAKAAALKSIIKGSKATITREGSSESTVVTLLGRPVKKMESTPPGALGDIVIGTLDQYDNSPPNRFVVKCRNTGHYRTAAGEYSRFLANAAIHPGPVKLKANELLMSL
jgi:hypothetical protein